MIINHTLRYSTSVLVILVTFMMLSVPADRILAQTVLENEKLKVQFHEQGIAEIRDKALNRSITLDEAPFRVVLADHKITDATTSFREQTSSQHTVSFHYQSGVFSIEAIYELRPGWRFVSKRLVLSTSRAGYRVEEMQPFRADLQNQVAEEYLHKEGRYGAFLRFADNDGQKLEYGAFWVLQNPFMQWERDENQVSMSYLPQMEWRSEYGNFTSDRVLIGTYELSGQTYPVNRVPEWKYLQHPESQISQEPQIDYAEIEALTACVEAFLLYNPKESLRVHVGWTENDFQINTATAEGRREYKRIVDQAAAVGAQHILYTPDHTGLTDLEENRDAWGWENLLWLNMGQMIRKGEWHPGNDALPADLKEMIDYAAKRDIGLLAYVFPTMPWMQNPEWTAWVDGKPGGYAGADTGIRSFQNWFVDLLIEFYEETGISGYSFDHWWVRYDQPGTTSMYAQWYGTRRILEELRQRAPEIVIDGRQQYHQLGPWTWLAGSYPHPMASDEQPQSFEAFPDLSWSRISADRTRYSNWWFRMDQFTPVQVMPGYMTHQTQRFNAEGELFRRRFRPRDWDYMGWKYSVLSSIGTAPLNHVINYLPARDSSEFKHFSEEDQQWFRRWFDWTDENIAYMRELRPIIGQPMVGRVDGTSAIIDDRGFLFLFNPNYRALQGTFRLDESIGLESGEHFVIRVLHPENEGLVGHPAGRFWRYGDQVKIPMEGTQAKVLEIVPADEISKPVLLNATGRVELDGSQLVARGVEGPVGHRRKLTVILPQEAEISGLSVNGQQVSFRQMEQRVTADVQFAGERFDHAQQVGTYHPNFTGGRLTRQFRIPKRIFEQLEQRRKEWPIPYTEDDLKAPWLGPHRLLLFVQIADPSEEMEVAMKIDGEPVDLQKAYSSVYPQENVTSRTFIGFYVDLTSELKPDKNHTVTVDLPELKPGQYQGLFFHNIVTEYTSEITEP